MAMGLWGKHTSMDTPENSPGVSPIDNLFTLPKTVAGEKPVNFVGVVSIVLLLQVPLSHSLHETPRVISGPRKSAPK